MEFICYGLITKQKLLCKLSDKLKGKEKEEIIRFIKERQGKNKVIYYDNKFEVVRYEV